MSRPHARAHGFVVLGFSLGLLACSKKDPPGTGEILASDAAPPNAALAPAPKAADKPVCPAPAPEKVAPYDCTTKVVKTPIPSIEDPKATLAPFYDRLSELARGTAKRRVRIGIYGDSNLTSDFLSGHLRRVLQGRFGDGGHGFVAMSQPWGSYRHQDVIHKGYWPMFKLYAPTTAPSRDQQYGFANMTAESSDVGAAAWVATTKNEKAVVGKTASHFELHYLKQPRGGSFTVKLDGKELKTLETKAPAFEAAVESIDTEDAPHELRAVVRGDGPVRLFGASLDRDVPGAPGIQVDSLGAGALNHHCLMLVANETRRAQLVVRDYDLVVLWLGTNVMFVPPNKEWANGFIKELRTALPGVPILVMSPGDTVLEGETKSNPRIVQVVKQMHEVAIENDAAWWDFREAMGGDGSMVGFVKRGLAGPDHIHFGPEGSSLMANRLLCAMAEDFDKHRENHPESGCVPKRGAADAGP